MSNEAVITVTYKSWFTTITKRTVSYVNPYGEHSGRVAEDFEILAEGAARYVSDLLESLYGRCGPSDPLASRCRLPSRQKLDLIQEIIDTGGNTGTPGATVLDKIREVLKR